jgi:hypothetical protein
MTRYESTAYVPAIARSNAATAYAAMRLVTVVIRDRDDRTMSRIDATL